MTSQTPESVRTLISGALSLPFVLLALAAYHVSVPTLGPLLGMVAFGIACLVALASVSLLVSRVAVTNVIPQETLTEKTSAK